MESRYGGRIEVKMPSEICGEKDVCGEERELKWLLETRHTHLTRLYMREKAMVGEVLMASEIAGNSYPLVIPFRLTQERLTLVAESENIEVLTKLIERMSAEPDDGSRLLFVRFLDSILLHDMESLQEIELTCYAMEKWLVSGPKDSGDLELVEPTTDILRYRKQLLMRDFYYQQFAELCDKLKGDEKHFFDGQALSLIVELEKRTDWLCDYSQMLREYLVQIRELYQQQIELQKNRTMQVLTVVTTIFLPLTLIAGWYGMNFEYMPELHSTYGYRVIIGVAVLIIVGEIFYFRRKKFL